MPLGVGKCTSLVTFSICVQSIASGGDFSKCRTVRIHTPTGEAANGELMPPMMSCQSVRVRLRLSLRFRLRPWPRPRLGYWPRLRRLERLQNCRHNEKPSGERRLAMPEIMLISWRAAAAFFVGRNGIGNRRVGPNQTKTLQATTATQKPRIEHN